jgi:hypothetical protein
MVVFGAFRGDRKGFFGVAWSLPSLYLDTMALKVPELEGLAAKG